MTPTIPIPPTTDSDRFTRTGERWIDFLEMHLKGILMGVVLVLAAAGGWAWMHHMQISREATRQGNLAEISALFPGDGNPVPATRIRTALERYQTFLAEGGGGLAHDMARLNLGRAHEALGDPGAARAAYEMALSSGSSEVTQVARFRLAYLAMNQGGLADATRLFEQVVRLDPALASQATLELGRVAELAHDPEAAMARYREVMKDAPAFPQAAEARARIRALGGDPDAGAKTETESEATPAAGAASEATPETAPAPETAGDATDGDAAQHPGGM